MATTTTEEQALVAKVMSGVREDLDQSDWLKVDPLLQRAFLGGALSALSQQVNGDRVLKAEFIKVVTSTMWAPDPLATTPLADCLTRMNRVINGSQAGLCLEKNDSAIINNASEEIRVYLTAASEADYGAITKLRELSTVLCEASKDQPPEDLTRILNRLRDELQRWRAARRSD
jgi:hypothetical protein